MTSKKEVYSLIEGFEARLSKSIIESKLAGKPEWVMLLEEISGIKDVFDALDDEEILTYKEASIIDKLKLGANVIALKNNNYTDIEVAEIVSTQTGQTILDSDISKWLESYSNLNGANPTAFRGSVFDTQSRMQNIMEDLYSHLEKVKMEDEDKFARAKTTRAQVELEVYKEIRQLTKDAAQIITAISNQNKMKQFQQIVVEAIATVSAPVANQITRKIREQKASYDTLLPPS